MEGLSHLYPLFKGSEKILWFSGSSCKRLKALGVSSKWYDNLLSSFLMNKIPQEPRLSVSREAVITIIINNKLDMLLKVLQEELEARERAVGAPNNYSPATNSPSRKMVSIGMILLQPQHSPLRHAPLQPVPIVDSLMPPTSARQWLMYEKGNPQEWKMLCLREEGTREPGLPVKRENKCFKRNSRHHFSIVTATCRRPVINLSQGKAQTSPLQNLHPQSCSLVQRLLSS